MDIKCAFTAYFSHFQSSESLATPCCKISCFVLQRGHPSSTGVSFCVGRKQERLRQAFMDEEVKHFLLERKKKPLPPSGVCNPILALVDCMPG